jgi:hypothetical protein
MLATWRERSMDECKHGLRHGCAYCHAMTAKPGRSASAGAKKPGKPSRLADKMNDRMTALKKRLREIRGE